MATLTIIGCRPAQPPLIFSSAAAYTRTHGAPAQDRGQAGGGCMAVALDLEKIPQELKDRPQWVCYRSNKIPVNPKTGDNAKADEPDTWGDFDQAVRHWEAHRGNSIAGIGYEFSPDDPFMGIDLDKCLDPKTGEIEPWARAIIDRLQSYTEISPSGCGVHILVRGKLPSGGNRKGGVEMYDSVRYFTMTGRHLEGTPTTIEDRDKELKVLHREVFGAPQAPSIDTGPHPGPALELSDFALIDKAHNATNGAKFSRLWQGDTTGYSSPSEADYALCLLLAYWTAKDAARMDRLFRQSGLCQDPERIKKWERLSAKTIEKAIAKTQEVYTPGKHQDPNRGNGKTRQDICAAHDQAEREAIQGEARAPNFPGIISAADLQNLVFPEIEYLIEDIMPLGFGLLSARPKKGKSYLALNISAAKATGGCALGNKGLRLDPGKVLYIAFEDKNRRVKNRLTTIMQGEPFPQRLYVAETWPRLPDGGLDRLDKWLTSNPDTRLVVIDTLGRFKPRKRPKQDDYEADLATGAALADLAHKHNVCILGVYHNRKTESDDLLDDVHGSTGMTAAADFVMVLKRGRGQADAELFVTGRDIEEKTLALRFHKAEGLWELLGMAEDVAKSQSRQEICLILKENGPMTTKELSEIIDKKVDTIKKLLNRMKVDNEVRFRNGKWELM